MPEKCCPRCLQTGDLATRFGYRATRGKVIPQSYCKRCRARPAVKSAPAPGAEPAPVEPPAAEPLQPGVAIGGVAPPLVSAPAEPMPEPEPGPGPESTPTVRQCTRCGQVKPLSEFVKDTAAPEGHRNYCLACKAAYRRERRNGATPTV